VPKFSNIPVEDDTTILFQTKALLGQYQVLYQKWVWDGIEAESIIFANEDVAGIDDADIEKLVRTSPIVQTGSSITMKRLGSYTFVNFNFQAE
jgi:hypothetical protein